MLLDSNVLVALTTRGHAHHEAVRSFLAGRDGLYVSALSRVEFLGWAAATPWEAALREVIYRDYVELPVDPVLGTAARLRARRTGLKTADAVIAATALRFDQPLVTANVRDFGWIEELTVIDPTA